MATWDDVRDLALELPEVTEDGEHHWKVRGKGFVWARPLRRVDLGFLGDAAPDGPVLGARVSDVGVQQALAQSDPGVYFVTPHFHGYPAVLVLLDAIDPDELRELVVEAWLAVAPKRLAKEHFGA